MDNIANVIGALRLGEGRAFQALTMIPVFAESPGPAPAYATLDDALARGEVEITEISEGGRVPELELVNRGERPVLLLDGEELAGAKQNRVLNLSVLAPPGTTRLPVSCVEAGRWAWRERRFRATGRTQYARARAEKLAQVCESRFTDQGWHADQHAVWDAIAEKQRRLGVHSATGAMSDLFEHFNTRIDDYVAAFHPEAGQTGALFQLDGRTEGLELFDHPDTLARNLPKIVRGYALDAIDPSRLNDAAPRRFPGPRDFLDRLAQADTHAFPSPGLGRDLRLEGEGLRGAALVWEGRVIHLVAFAMGTPRPRHRPHGRNRATNS